MNKEDLDPLRQAVIDESGSSDSIPNNIVDAAKDAKCLFCPNEYCRDKLSPFGKDEVPETIYNLLLKMECEPDRRVN